MFGSNLVKIFLIFYAIIAVGVFSLLWRNSAAPDALTSIGILLASMLPVLIAVLPYLSRNKEIERHFQYILLYDSKEKKIIEGDQNQYWFNYMDMFFLPDTNAIQADTDNIAQSKGLDIIEKGIIVGLVWKFHKHWDVELSKNVSPLWINESVRHDSKYKTKLISWKELKNIFNYNKLFLMDEETMHPSKFAVPSDCNFQTKKDEDNRTIKFSNSYMTLKIFISPSETSVIWHEIKGVFSPDKKEFMWGPNEPNRYRYYLIVYRINANLSIKRGRTYAPEMESYRKWFGNICDALSKYDWNTLNEQIEKSSLNRAIYDISEIKKRIIPPEEPNSLIEKK